MVSFRAYNQGIGCVSQNLPQISCITSLIKEFPLIKVHTFILATPLLPPTVFPPTLMIVSGAGKVQVNGAVF